jgi:lysophospholipid acyltransferase (LPLAT)-like uncharacterized protein
VKPRMIRNISRLLRMYLQFVSRTSMLRIGLDDGRTLSLLCDPVEVAEISVSFSVRPTVVTFWNAHSLLFVTSYLSLANPLRAQLSNFHAAADDTAGGRITCELLARLGIGSRRISFTDSAQRLEDIRGLLREKPQLGIAADSHGPYREVSAGLARFLKTYGGVVRPMSVWCDRGIPIFHQIRMLLPLPYSALTLGIGQPIDLRTSSLRVGDLREQLQRSLSELERRVLSVTKARRGLFTSKAA